MNIIAIKTSEPRAYIALYNDHQLVSHLSWQADRQLAATLHKKINELINEAKLSIDQINGFVCFEGPGSFTGLRIGLATANSLAYSLGIGISSAGGSSWESKGIEKLLSGHNDRVVIPRYGADAHITKPKH